MSQNVERTAVAGHVPHAGDRQPAQLDGEKKDEDQTEPEWRRASGQQTVAVLVLSNAEWARKAARARA